MPGWYGMGKEWEETGLMRPLGTPVYGVFLWHLVFVTFRWLAGRRAEKETPGRLYPALNTSVA